MADDLKEINEKLTTLLVKSDNVEKVISDMKDEREKHKDTFWINMNIMKEDLHSEREARIAGDSSVNTDLRVLKAKLAAWATAISVVANAAFYFIKSRLTS